MKSQQTTKLPQDVVQDNEVWAQVAAKECSNSTELLPGLVISPDDGLSRGGCVCLCHVTAPEVELLTDSYGMTAFLPQLGWSFAFSQFP